MLIIWNSIYFIILGYAIIQLPEMLICIHALVLKALNNDVVNRMEDDQGPRSSSDECQETKSDNEDYMDYRRVIEKLENRVLELETRISPRLSKMIKEDAINHLHMT